MKLKHILAMPLIMLCGTVEAATVYHDAGSFSGALTPPFGALVEAVGPFFEGSGVDYGHGNVEGVFSDGDAMAICGISASGLCDLLTTVDARIVVVGSGAPGVTSRIFAEAGLAEAGTLSLNAFDNLFNLLASVRNSDDVLGPNGRSTFEIDREGVFDIAYFTVSGEDAWGLNYVEIASPIAPAPIPLPAAGWMLLAGLASLASLGRHRTGSNTTYDTGRSSMHT